MNQVIRIWRTDEIVQISD